MQDAFANRPESIDDAPRQSAWNAMLRAVSRTAELQHVISTYRKITEHELSHSARADLLSSICRRVSKILDLRVQRSGSVPTEPCLLVANHQSYIDPIVIGAEVACSALAKEEVKHWPYLGPLLHGLGVEFVRRNSEMSSVVALRRCTYLLRSGMSVLVFPEGSTTFGEEVLPFHSGIFQIARLAQVPIVPISLRYENEEVCWVGEESFLPHLMRLLREPEIRLSIAFHAPIAPEFRESVEVMADRCRQTIRERIIAP